MITFNEIEATDQFSQIELRQHMLEIISKIAEGAIYDPSIYGHFVLVKVETVSVSAYKGISH